MVYRLLVYFTATEENEVRLLETLLEIKELMINSKGCIEGRVYRDVEEIDRFILFEVWSTEHHQKRFAQFLRQDNRLSELRDKLIATIESDPIYK